MGVWCALEARTLQCRHDGCGLNDRSSLSDALTAHRQGNLVLLTTGWLMGVHPVKNSFQ
jgi:hypothetical protein